MGAVLIVVAVLAIAWLFTPGREIFVSDRVMKGLRIYRATIIALIVVGLLLAARSISAAPACIADGGDYVWAVCVHP